AEGAKGLDELCRVGVHALVRFEQALHDLDTSATSKSDEPEWGSVPPVEAYEFYRALFRSRLLGHALIKRRLRCYKDFIDLRERHGPGRLLIPQTTLGAVERLHFSRGRDLIADLQRRCLKASEAQTLEGLSCPWPIHLVPGRGVVDYLLVDGLYRRQGGL